MNRAEGLVHWASVSLDVSQELLCLSHQRFAETQIYRLHSKAGSLSVEPGHLHFRLVPEVILLRDFAASPG